MKLIIAEKPSLARNIIASLDNMKKNNGYYENGEYIVVWAFGHLFTLADVEEYYNLPLNSKWTIDNLPCFPEKFKFTLIKDQKKEIDKGILKQFNIIKNLINRDDVDGVINAGDADREGEVIVRLIIENALEKEKEELRLWLPDQTTETILEGLNDLKSEHEYDSLAKEGYARTYIDWLYGVNLTRYATLKTGLLLRVGRVIIPIVKAIYDRDMEIKNFKKEKYYIVSSKELTNGEEIELNGKDHLTKEKASNLADIYNQNIAKVIDKKQKKDTLNPPKLFSLSKLQNYLGKKYKISMTDSLNIVQGLYEKGYLTYPRTNTEYLATKEKGKIKTILKNISDIGYPVEFKDKKTIFDDSKIESHSALTPTYKIPDKNSLSDQEFLIYQIVFKRFVAVFCSEECKVEKTDIKIKVGDLEEFNLKGTVILEKGWTRFETPTTKDKLLPNLSIGDEIVTKFEVKERETTPPKHYTIETLNNYLMNPFRDDKKELDENDDRDEYKAIFEGLELGTDATRTGIINNAINSKYIALSKDVYTILDGGIFLIESLKQMNISMDKYKTSEMGKALKKVYRNEISIDDCLSLAKTEISDVFGLKNVPIEKDIDTGFIKDVIGICPKCGGDVIKSRYSYSCSNYQNCDFKISLNICNRVISKANAELLLNTGKTSKIEGFISKNNKEFSAYLILDKENKIVFSFE